MKGTAPFPYPNVSFVGMSLFLDFPAGQTLNGTYVLQPESFVRVTLYDTSSNRSANVTSPMQFVDLAPPAVNGCPANQTFYASSLPNGYSTTVNWVPPTATDIRHVKSLTSNFVPNTTFAIGVYDVCLLYTSPSPRD